jgi:methionyl-tRNA formyltransferase
MRLLFLGNNYNPLSVACLCALLSITYLEVLVGIAERRDLRVTAGLVFRRYGIGGLVDRAAIVIGDQVRRAASRMKIRFRKLKTIREVAGIHKPMEFRFDNINRPEICSQLRELGLDLIVVAGFGQILTRRVIDIPRVAVLNVHPSLLPEYRGPTPCHWVIRNGEKTTGVTVHHIDENIDSGDIVGRLETDVFEGESPRGLEKRLAPLGANLLVHSLEMIRAGKASRTAQDQQKSSYFSFPRKGQIMAQGLRVMTPKTKTHS